MSSAGLAPYKSPLLQQVTGPALRPGGLALTKRALAYCGFAPGNRVLDLGCGLGVSAGHMTEELGLRVLGLDLSADMLSDARRSRDELPLIQASAQAIPLASASLDGIVCECVLSLTESPLTVLTECCRVLRTGGKLVLSDLYLRDPPAMERRVPLQGCLGGALGRDKLEAMLATAGLEVLLWEDHSRLLRELAARLVWEHGAADAFWPACGHGNNCSDIAERANQTRPGYFLLMARRKAEAIG